MQSARRPASRRVTRVQTTSIQGVTGALLEQVVWGSVPFLLLLLLGATLIVVFPQTALWLPTV